VNTKGKRMYQPSVSVQRSTEINPYSGAIVSARYLQ
jgi:hypothetical protein